MKKHLILHFGDFEIPCSYKNEILKPKGICSGFPPIHIHEDTSFIDIADEFHKTIESKKRLFGPDFKKRQELDAKMKRLAYLQDQLRKKKAEELRKKKERLAELKKLEMLGKVKRAPTGKIGKYVYNPVKEVENLE